MSCALLLIWTLILLQTSLGNFNCISHRSGESGGSDDDTTTRGCTDPNYPTLVSCGFESDVLTDSDIDGGWMESDLCYARNGAGGRGIYAHARCCDFRHLGDVECEGSNFGSDQLTENDKSAQGQCDTEYNFLTGCSVQSKWKFFDGAYAGKIEPGLVNNCLFTFCVINIE